MCSGIYTVLLMLSDILDNLMSKLYELYSEQHVKRSLSVNWSCPSCYFHSVEKKNCSYMTYAKKPQHYEKIQLNLIISCYFRQLLVGE